MRHEDYYREFTDEQISEMFINETRFQRGYKQITRVKKTKFDEQTSWTYKKGVKTYKK